MQRRVIKLTRADGTTREGFRYVVGGAATAPSGGDLCSEAYLHAYRTALEAVFFRPLHGVQDYDTAWIADAVVEREDDVTKLGCTSLTLRAKTTLPTISTETRITVAILCALNMYDPEADDGSWGRWAERWLSGKNRTRSAALMAMRETFDATLHAAASAACAANVLTAAKHAAFAVDAANAMCLAAVGVARVAKPAINQLLQALGVGE